MRARSLLPLAAAFALLAATPVDAGRAPAAERDAVRARPVAPPPALTPTPAVTTPSTPPAADGLPAPAAGPAAGDDRAVEATADTADPRPATATPAAAPREIGMSTRPGLPEAVPAAPAPVEAPAPTADTPAPTADTPAPTADAPTTTADGEPIWAFGIDARAATASAWISAADGPGSVGLRCAAERRPGSAAGTVAGTGAPAPAASPSPGFVDLVVDDALFFGDTRPERLASAPFQVSQLRIGVDQARMRTFNARYDRAAAHYVTVIPLDDPFLEGLMAGYTLWLDEPLAEGRVSLPLTGSRDAITSLITFCP